MQDLASQISLEKLEQTCNVLEALKTICERYRSQAKTKAIVEELKFVLDTLVGKKVGESNNVGVYSSQPLREISSSLFNMIVNQSPQSHAKHVIDSLISVTNIFYSLNFKVAMFVCASEYQVKNEKPRRLNVYRRYLNADRTSQRYSKTLWTIGWSFFSISCA